MELGEGGLHELEYERVPQHFDLYFGLTLAMMQSAEFEKERAARTELARAKVKQQLLNWVHMVDNDAKAPVLEVQSKVRRNHRGRGQEESRGVEKRPNRPAGQQLEENHRQQGNDLTAHRH